MTYFSLDQAEIHHESPGHPEKKLGYMNSIKNLLLNVYSNQNNKSVIIENAYATHFNFLKPKFD